ncbi:MAG TPA: class I SAM-dependent methyltransferase [Cyclobacteriaceae bacterium]|nr:class I SAM-dependent methyltransferase [Cyclobacteriaceae bacterium]
MTAATDLDQEQVSYQSVNDAFSKQSRYFDDEDDRNPVLQYMRAQVYKNVDKYIRPNSNILEINAGTGIDALRFVQCGHTVLATDLSDGMIQQIERKKELLQLKNKLRCTQLSYENLGQLKGQKFDFVFSNMGGLNCLDDLTKVTRHLPALLKPSARITWVVMPPTYLWELIGLLKGNLKSAFRRFHTKGTIAHLEGEYFKTYYHSLSAIKRAFDPSFRLIGIQGLCALVPPPHLGNFPVKYPRLFNILKKIDECVHNSFPFNRWADHIIVTFEYNGK